MQRQFGSPTRFNPTKETTSPVRRTSCVPTDCEPNNPVRRSNSSVTVSLKPTPSKSNDTSQSPLPTKRISESCGSMSFPTALKEIASPIPWKDSRISASVVHQLVRTPQPSFSSTERMFLLRVIDANWFELMSAIYLATIFHWKYHRPLQALLLAIGESSRNCSARNEGPKPLSGVRVSSSKRSSGA